MEGKGEKRVEDRQRGKRRRRQQKDTLAKGEENQENVLSQRPTQCFKERVHLTTLLNSAKRVNTDHWAWHYLNKGTLHQSGWDVNGEERMTRHLRNAFNMNDQKTNRKTEIAGNRYHKKRWWKDEEVLRMGACSVAI